MTPPLAPHEPQAELCFVAPKAYPLLSGDAREHLNFKLISSG